MLNTKSVYNSHGAGLNAFNSDGSAKWVEQRDFQANLNNTTGADATGFNYTDYNYMLDSFGMAGMFADFDRQ